MNPVNKAIVDRLVGQTESENLVLSLFAPMHRAGREVQQNEIVWKNVLTEARKKLAESGADEEEADKLLSAASRKLEDETFWQHQSDGLAYFSDGDSSEFLKLDHEVESITHVSNEYLIGPVASSLADLTESFILACSPKRVRLLKVTGNSVADLDPEELPENLVEALNIDEYVSALQHRSTANSSTGSQKATTFHGHGGSDPDVKKQDEILQYFHVLDRALDSAIGSHTKNGDACLIFAGVDYLFPIFKEASSYPNLCDEAISGNPDDLKPAELLEKAQPIIRAMADEKVIQQLSEFSDKNHSDWASLDESEVSKAAVLGQIKTLFVSDEASRIEYSKCISLTIQYGGKIVLVEQSQLEDMNLDFDIAAIFRTPAGSFLDAVEAVEDSIC
ncbi:baeRF7 domain-containing protein [Mariniblastus fucicola]|uniref:Uncharacterized protein n=1 Tax=Mariniblastus fucicola TaxID=980251 RepID=A0A5B9PJU9_9BACT|nr:hypothetical protein [Mariniblastus fucicola]QEG24946.1 hypothetical protein MFFC18_48690 [Mariniblastus fucicola]